LVAVALAALNNKLHMVQVGEHSPQLYYSSSPGTATFSNNEQRAGRGSLVAVALAALNNKLHMVQVGEHSPQLYYSSSPGTATFSQKKTEAGKQRRVGGG